MSERNVNDVAREFMPPTALSEDNSHAVQFTIGMLKNNSEQAVTATPEALFQDNCLVVGSIGSGKSWTIARLFQECARFRSKVILFDRKGQHSEKSHGIFNLNFQRSAEISHNKQSVAIRTEDLNLWELYTLFRLGAEERAYFLDTINQVQRPINHSIVGGENISLEAMAIGLDMTNQNDNVDDKYIRFKNKMISTLHDKAFQSVFADDGVSNILGEIDRFLFDDSDYRVLRISTEGLMPNGRLEDVILNLVCRHIHARYMTGDDEDLNPCVLFVEDVTAFSDNAPFLDAFRSLFSLSSSPKLRVTASISDLINVPEEVLMRIGTLFIHRIKGLPNIECLNKWAGSVEESYKAMIPYFLPGDALLINARLHAPYLMRVGHPDFRPRDNDLYQRYWRYD